MEHLMSFKQTGTSFSCKHPIRTVTGSMQENNQVYCSEVYQISQNVPFKVWYELDSVMRCRNKESSFKLVSGKSSEKNFFFFLRKKIPGTLQHDIV